MIHRTNWVLACPSTMQSFQLNYQPASLEHWSNVSWGWCCLHHLRCSMVSAPPRRAMTIITTIKAALNIKKSNTNVVKKCFKVSFIYTVQTVSCLMDKYLHQCSRQMCLGKHKMCHPWVCKYALMGSVSLTWFDYYYWLEHMDHHPSFVFQSQQYLGYPKVTSGHMQPCHFLLVLQES